MDLLLYQMGQDNGHIKATQSEQSRTLYAQEKRIARVELRQAILMRITFLVIVGCLSATGQLNRAAVAEFIGGVLKGYF